MKDVKPFYPALSALDGSAPIGMFSHGAPQNVSYGAISQG